MSLIMQFSVCDFSLSYNISPQLKYYTSRATYVPVHLITP
jgi:hypothetical protein